MKKFGNALIIILTFLFTSNCQEDEIINEYHSQDITNAKIWFENNEQALNQKSYNFGRSSNTFTKYPDWAKSNVYKMQNGYKAIEVSLNYETNLLVLNDNDNPSRNSNVANSMLMIETSPNSFSIYLLKIFSQNESFSFNSFNMSRIPPDFNGDMMLFDWNERFIGGWKIKNGVKEFFYAKSSTDSKIKDSPSNSSRTSAWNCYIVTTYWYSQACVRGGGCADPVLIDITYTQACEYILAPGDDSGSGGPGDPTANTCFLEHPYIYGLLVPCNEVDASEADQWENEKICLTQSFIDNQCLNRVWTLLNQQNSAFRLLKNFNNENPTAQLCMEAVPSLTNSQGQSLNGSTNGQTNPIQVKINASAASQRSDLEVARTIFHELVHAEMWRKIQSIGGTTNLSPSNFPGLFDYYSRYLPIPDGNGGFNFPNGTPQHNLMANHYIEMITDALMEFDGEPKENYTIRASYEALAWGGLKETENYIMKPDYEKFSINLLLEALVKNRIKCN